MPVLNIPKADFNLRQDVVFIFDLLKLKPDTLLFLDDPDLDLAAIQASGRLDLTLVDHNVLAARQAALDLSISSIVDHHVNEDKYPHVKKKNIHLVGSCASLIAEIAMAKGIEARDPSGGGSGDGGGGDVVVAPPLPVTSAAIAAVHALAHVNPALTPVQAAAYALGFLAGKLGGAEAGSAAAATEAAATPAAAAAAAAAARDGREARSGLEMNISKAEAWMLLSAILIDTINHDPTAGRGTLIDAEMSAALSAHAGVTDTNELYHELFKAKQDVDALSADELLRKDFKEYLVAGLKIGIAAVPAPITTVLDKPDGRSCHDGFCGSKGLDVLLVMTAYEHAETQAFTREIAAYVRPDHAAQLPALQTLLLGGGLGLEPLAPSNLWPTAVAYTQKEIKQSRKKIAPLIKTFVPVASSM